MVQFEYECSRSQEAAHQVEKIKNALVLYQGTMPANSIYAVRDFCRDMMVIPGVYLLKIRNLKEAKWVEFDPIDTRTRPEGRKTAISTSRRKPRTK